LGTFCGEGFLTVVGFVLVDVAVVLVITTFAAGVTVRVGFILVGNVVLVIVVELVIVVIVGLVVLVVVLVGLVVIFLVFVCVVGFVAKIVLVVVGERFGVLGFSVFVECFLFLYYLS